jgi:tetratricopeptide (TPR) repeat protein
MWVRATLPRIVTVGAALLLGSMALPGCDDQGAVEQRIDVARVFLQQDDAQAAIAELKRALQETPEDADLRLMLGQVYLRIGDLPYAEKELSRANALRPQSPDVVLAQGELWLRQKHEAQLLDEIAPQPDWPMSAQTAALNLRARAHLGLDDPAGAHRAYQAILDAEPDNVDARIGQIRIAMRQNDPGTSERLLADALRIAPDHATLLGLKGDLAFRLARYPDAVGTYRKQLEVAVGGGTPRLALAEALLAAGELAEAGALLDDFLANRPGNGLGHYLRAVVAYQAGDAEVARMHSERALAAIPTHVPSMFIAGASSYELGRLEAAHWNLERVLAREPDHASARLLLAATNRQLERSKADAANAADAGETLFRVDLAVVQSGELAGADTAEEGVEAGRRARAGDHGGAARILARLESAAPGDASVLELGGGLAALAGRPQAAARAFEAALEQRPAPALARKLALAHWRAGDSAASETAHEAWLARSPDDLETRLSLADLYLAANRPAAARDQLMTVVTSRPTGAAGLNNLAWALLEEGRARAARVYAERALGLAPDEARVMDTLAVVLTEQGELDRAVELLQRAARAETRYPEVEAHLARALAQRGDGEAAREILLRLLDEPGTLPARDEAAAEALLRDLGS